MENLFKTYEDGKYYWRFFFVKDGNVASERFEENTDEKEIEIMISQKIINREYLIENIAQNMFETGSSSYSRRAYRGQSTHRITLEHLKRHVTEIVEIWGEKDIRTLKEMDVVNYLVKKERSNSWKNEFLAALREIYREASWNSLNVVMPNIQNFKKQMNKADIFTWHELKVFLNRNNFKNDSMYVFFVLCFHAGLRIGEVCGARVNQLVSKKNAFVVDGYIDNDGSRTIYNKKGSAEKPKYRAVIIPSKVVKILDKYIKENNLKEDDFLFTRNGVVMTRYYPESQFRQALKKSGIDRKERKLVPHSLRYSYITYMRMNFEGDIVRQFAGHNQMEMTDYYTRANLTDTIDSLQAMVKKVNSIFS